MRPVLFPRSSHRSIGLGLVDYAGQASCAIQGVLRLQQRIVLGAPDRSGNAFGTFIQSPSWRKWRCEDR
ncbi:hypothetical protein PsYK624_052080 [Phanerochaete sordida]|uniref:Uncharacterized protein n=1 Tax=Phanerochaete sordida TaxID=48140 RepID=A0A9P3G792_9APHY|nr:hypothetical protein PsYK624_052080 [Phanerochaete sordida]